MKNKVFYLLLIALNLLLCAENSNKLNVKNISLNNFKKIIILEDGRKKPLDTFAQNTLKKFSGKSRYKKNPAINWLAGVLFNSPKIQKNKIFLINNTEVLNSIGMEPSGVRDRYSFSQLKTFLPKLHSLAFSISKIKGEERTIVENEIIFTYNKLYIYQQLIGSFSFALPHEDFSISDPELIKYLKLPENKRVFCLLDLIKKWDIINKVRQDIQGKTYNDLSSIEKKIVKISEKINNWFILHRRLPLTIIPGINKIKEEWLSPWDSLYLSCTKNIAIKKEIYLINDFINAYLKGNQKEFDIAVKSFNQLILEQLKGKPNNKIISLEVIYNKVNPFYRCKFFYGFSLVFLLLSFLFLKKWFYKISLALLILGIIPQTFGIIARMIIMGRPPVTTLYETFVFTGWVTVLLGIILEFFKKKNTGILTGSISGLLLLMIAGKYALEGDTMGMLVAVLDSNFWLASHITTITVGYAGIVISGIIGHLYILQHIFIPEKKDILKNTFNSIYSTQAFGLIFTFIGTVLGGIWADQSWGRFWGWDPKENGALVIILWSAILFHAKLAKMIKDRGFAFGSIIGIIAVALAWFGVNLLGVGLHSYGFTSGITTILLIFLLFELIFILTTAFCMKRG